MLRHERVQYPAGQGFFHVGTVASGGVRIDYLYDCGTTTGSAALQASIEDAVETGWLAQPRDDVAFLSHLHRDHVNGLRRLRRLERMPQTIVLPYLDDVARLISFAEDAAVARRDDDDPFLADVVVEGTAALRRYLNPDRIYEVHPTAEPPGEDIADAPRDRTDYGESRLEFEPGDPGRTRAGSGGVLAVSHEVPFVVHRTRWDGPRPLWLLKTHVDEGRSDARACFLRRLDEWRERSGVDQRNSVEDWLRASEVRRMLVDRHPEALVEAFGGSPRLNATSLSLYSGPMERFAAWEVTTAAGFFGRRPGLYSYSNPDRVAWIGTGDACLTADDGLDKFLQHFADVLDTVGTLTSPHHGSRENSDPALYASVRAPHVVVAASPRARYGHPHAETTGSASSSGSRVVVVSEEERSQFTERFEFRD